MLFSIVIMHLCIIMIYYIIWPLIVHGRWREKLTIYWPGIIQLYLVDLFRNNRVRALKVRWPSRRRDNVDLTLVISWNGHYHVFLPSTWRYLLCDLITSAKSLKCNARTLLRQATPSYILTCKYIKLMKDYDN